MSKMQWIFIIAGAYIVACYFNLGKAPGGGPTPLATQFGLGKLCFNPFPGGL